ncbi:protein naked cuticle-like protein 2 [Triplophysa rosa]|uniref:Protein naked cuticle-like protein 2 n=1 Tax=Triplophysa rosa TaxID=992332 RepID=A0A9W7WR09_TRIRA|nr:protein naked cuticle-like protein 2 [Triplophysa rosa]
MGKLHSKHACKRRENPEGDSFGVNAFISRRGVEDGTPEPRLKEFQGKWTNSPGGRNRRLARLEGDR